MKKSERRVLVLVIVVVAVIAIQMAFTIVTDRRRANHLAQIEKPQSMAVYEQLAAELAQRNAKETVATSVQNSASETAAFDKARADSIAAFERFLSELKEKWGGELLPVDIWSAIDTDPQSWTDEQWAEMEWTLRERKHLIERLRELAARGGPFCPLDFSKGFAISVNHLRELRECARLLKADAIINGANGDYGEAVKDIVAGMQLANALTDEPLILSQLVRFAMYNTTKDAVEQSFDGGDVPPELVSELLTLMGGAYERHALTESFTAEKIVGLQEISGIGNDGQLPEGMGNGPSFSVMGLYVPRDVVCRFYATPIGRPWLNMDMSEYADHLDRMTELAELPYYEARPDLEQLDQDFLNMSRMRVMTGSMTPALMRVCQAQARHEATLDVMQMGLLVEQYHAQHDSYPETLDAIAPQLGGSLPVDPFTGEPYRYYPDGDSFQLYSIGPNLTDDGGIENQSAWVRGDIAWRGRKEEG